jgi:signal transduction histidine kinase
MTTPDTISGLRPTTLDDSGIVAAIEELIRVEEKRGGLEIEFHCNMANDRLEPFLENTVFRIIQESLTNVRRHSTTDRLRIEVLMRENEIRVEIRDWGIGFDPKAVKGGHFGLEGMKERTRLLGGKIVIDSAPGMGTHIVAVLPRWERFVLR